MEAMGGRGTLRKWTSAGRELQGVDPKRFADLLELAERIVRIHQDPMGIPLSPRETTSAKGRARRRP